MARKYQRDDRDRWTGSHTDDDFSMGLGQESRTHWDEANEGFQEHPSRWQRSQFRIGGEPLRSGGQFVGRGPKNYKRSDERIEEDVNEMLTRHGGIDATDVEVSVQNGEVTLRGNVDSRQAKRLAEDISDNVSGVKDVNNEIKIKQRTEAA